MPIQILHHLVQMTSLMRVMWSCSNCGVVLSGIAPKRILDCCQYGTIGVPIILQPHQVASPCVVGYLILHSSKHGEGRLSRISNVASSVSSGRCQLIRPGAVVRPLSRVIVDGRYIIFVLGINRFLVTIPVIVRSSVTSIISVASTTSPRGLSLLVIPRKIRVPTFDSVAVSQVILPILGHQPGFSPGTLIRGQSGSVSISVTWNLPVMAVLLPTGDVL